MQTFSFTIYVKEDITTEQANKLHEVAPDATIGACCGSSYIHFDRENTFERSTINEAAQQVQSVGLTAIKVIDKNNRQWE